MCVMVKEGVVVREQNPYPWAVLNFLDELAIFSTYPLSYVGDKLLCNLVFSYSEKANYFWSILRRIPVIPFLLVCTLVTLPLGVVGFCLWWFVSAFRKPYRVSYSSEAGLPVKQKTNYNFATANVCLGYEFFCKFNCMNDPRKRAKLLAKNISDQQFQAQIKDLAKPNKWQMLEGVDLSESFQSTEHESPNSSFSHFKFKPGTDLPIDHDIKTEFPSVDVFCIQELWDLHQARDVATLLHQHYPYIIYDVGEYGLLKNCYFLNSGLVIASKFPFLNIRYNRFKTRGNFCRLTAMGCLQAKVDLGTTASGHRKVGYVFNLHLQSYQGSAPITAMQMTSVLQWAEQFKADTLQDMDIITFDVMAGDFNSDNMSPMNHEDQHHQLFRTYVDVCRVMPGEDQPWTVGTEMCHATLHESPIQTPGGTKAVLQDPYLRQYYFIDANIKHASLDFAYRLPDKDEHGDWILDPAGGRRRIDYILCRVGTPVRIKACNVVTQLAGMTDHLACTISLQANCSKAALRHGKD